MVTKYTPPDFFAQQINYIQSFAKYKHLFGSPREKFIPGEFAPHFDLFNLCRFDKIQKSIH